MAKSTETGCCSSWRAVRKPMGTAHLNLLQQCIDAIPRGGEEYTTNLYADRKQLEHWSQQTLLQVKTTLDGTVLVLRADRGFNHLYHVAQSRDALISALKTLPPGRYVADLVGKGDMLDKVCAAYASAGFTSHSFLRRMTRTSHIHVLNDASSQNVTELAHPETVPAVAAFLDDLLDPLTEQLPNTGELTAAAQDGRLLVVNRRDVLAGMLMYDFKGQVAHLRFWHVAPSAWGTGVGRALMAGFLKRCVQSQRIVLWVIGSNDRSIAIYRHYGFETDGLLDQIMTLHKD